MSVLCTVHFRCSGIAEGVSPAYIALMTLILIELERENGVSVLFCRPDGFCAERLGKRKN